MKAIKRVVEMDSKLGKGKKSYDHEQYPREAVKTNAIAEPFVNYEDDGIHLRTGLEQP